MTNSSYPGNPSLPAEVKNRVLATFRQSVELFKQGRTNEVISGCEFIAKMDPVFDPAKKLLQKARNPAAPVDVEGLLGAIGGEDQSLAEARAALAARDFERAEQLAEAVLGNDLTNIEAQKIAQEARERSEAQPFVSQFLEKAREQKAAGNASAASATIEKARALDPGNPQLKEFETAAAASAPMSFDFGADSSPFGSAFTPPQSGAAPPRGSAFDSFVVEPPSVPPTPPSAGGPTSDFGFTFEEEQKPAAPAPGEPRGPHMIPGTPGEFDFNTATVEVTAEDQSKIAKYLAEGDQAFDAGEYQKAIDLWSRIFLIDVTHEEASARIDKARAKRVEIDRKVEELVVAGTRAAERGEVAGARAKLEEALQLDPTNFTASEQLERLASGAPPPVAAPSAGAAAPPPVSDDLFAEDFSTPQRSTEALVPPPPTAARPRAAAAVAPAAAPKAPSKTMLYAAVGVGVIVLALAGWFGLNKLRGGGDYDETRTAATITEAQTLAGQGQFDQAITLLSAIKREDPQYDRALSLIADLQRKKTQATAQRRPPMEVFNEQVARGQTAFAAQDFVTAKQAFEQAAAIQALPLEAKAQYDAAAAQVARMQSASVLFKEGKYREALIALQAMLLQDPQNQSIRQMISDAHFNLGQLALQEEKTEEAMAYFDQVLAANPTDELARRSRDLAARYNRETKDLLYKIFVKYLPLRGLS